MRRLLALVSIVVLVDTMLFAALTPLLPHFAHELHLSSAGAGLLVAAYAAGALLTGIPGGFLVVRLGPRRTVLIGLTLMGLASIGFAVAGTFDALVAARLLQGGGSAFTWSGAFAWLIGSTPRERRGEVIGTAMGAAVVGALLGPAVGALASALTREAVFSGVAALALVLMALTTRIPDAACERASLPALGRAFRTSLFTVGLALLGLGALLSGVLSVLAPLRLAAGGWGAAAIGAVWLVAAAIEATLSPAIGRLSDRRGALVPVRWALLGGAIASLVLAAGAGVGIYAALIVAASILFGGLFTPAFALIADGADAAGLAQGIAFGVMNAAWAVGAMLGPAAAGALASATGDTVPLLLAAAVCAVALAFTMRGVLSGERLSVEHTSAR
ncbi:MAG TPA: MFS transporter [Solirubrobacteraceae bacterium]|jgi:MFS family permease|nr:MFS transporter [Solirubrobacteraceae bacterium]